MKKFKCTKTKLVLGDLNIYDFGTAKLYAYKTNDYIDDEVFIIEKNGNAVVIESPCFYDNILELEDFIKSKNMKVAGVLTSHYTPENLKDVETKIAYIENLKKIAQTCASKAEFEVKVQKEYPKYSGKNYLEMTSGFFFEK